MLLTGLQVTDIQITIIRQREVATAGRGAAFMVDCLVAVGGQTLFPQVFPTLPVDDIVAALPVPPSTKLVDCSH